MTDVLSIQLWVWDIETCWSYFKKGTRAGGRIMEGWKKLPYNTCIYGNVIMKSPV
jgi:hypothetical protein